ncbi:hypothetical protein AOLI_G00015470 [Acnodon oligacanthus]
MFYVLWGMYMSLFLVLPFAFGCKGLHVHGPSGPLVAQLGDTVLLPCFSRIPLPLEGLQVEWRKAGSESLVILFQQGENRPDLQSQSFRDRVHLFPDEISKGNFSILLNNVIRNDTGVYRCKVSTTQESSETEVELHIEDLVKGADHAIFASVGEEVILNCSVDSSLPAHMIEEVSWKKRSQDQDHLILFFQDSEVFLSHESYQDRAELFITEIPKGNFSLKVKDVKLEDKGEFLCEVHTSDWSAHTTVVLQKLGFSTSQILILVLCLIALQLSVGLCVPIFILLKKKATSGKVLHASLILCPNICLFVAFILWSTEGSLTEAVTCSTVSILRPLMLMKTFPHLDRFPQRLATTVKALVVPVYHSVITITACSIFSPNIRQMQTGSERMLIVLVVLQGMCSISAAALAGCSLRMHSTVVLQICNGAVLGFILIIRSKEDFQQSFLIPSILVPNIIGIMMVLTLQRHYFQGKPFRCLHIVLSSTILTIFNLAELSVYILIGISTNNFTTTWILPLEAVIHAVAWLSVIFLLRCNRCHKQRCHFVKRGIGYACCTVISAVLIITFGVVCIYYVNVHMENYKDRGGYMALTAFLHVLSAISLFKHPEHLPDLPHILIYMFGAVGLNIVNSITLMTELILKADKGAPTFQDLRVIVLPFETVFVSAWLALQVYHFWMGTRLRIKQNSEDQREAGPQHDVTRPPIVEFVSSHRILKRWCLCLPLCSNPLTPLRTIRYLEWALISQA